MLVLLLSRPHAETRETAFDRQALAFGISGDRPLVVVEAAVRGIDSSGRSHARCVCGRGAVSRAIWSPTANRVHAEMPLQRELAAIREQYARDARLARPRAACGGLTTLLRKNGRRSRYCLAALRRRSPARGTQDHIEARRRLRDAPNSQSRARRCRAAHRRSRHRAASSTAPDASAFP